MIMEKSFCIKCKKFNAEKQEDLTFKCTCGNKFVSEFEFSEKDFDDLKTEVPVVSEIIDIVPVLKIRKTDFSMVIVARLLNKTGLFVRGSQGYTAIKPDYLRRKIEEYQAAIRMTEKLASSFKV
jgi:hypothetical protein